MKCCIFADVSQSLVVQIIYSAASIQGLFLSFLLLKTKINQPANRILAILLAILSFHLILVGFDNRDFFLAFPHLSRISWIIGSLYWPLLFLFVSHISQTAYSKWWKNLWLFLPFVVLLIVMLPYYGQSASAKRELLSNFEEASNADFGVINQIVSLLHLVFQVFILGYYLRFEKKLYEEYSDVEAVRIRWLKEFLVLTLAATALAVFSFFVRSWQVPILSQLYSFHFMGIVLLFYWLSYKALTQPVLFGIGKEAIAGAPAPVAEETIDKYKKSSLENQQLVFIFEKVKTTLESEKLYLDHNLTLRQLSEATQITKHQISQAINSCYSGNFFDLINSYRIEAFQQLAAQPENKHLSLLGIAQEAGFNSKASFYAVFKKKTGMTPSEYLDKQAKAA
jgi:AraC-like DNA-binding protein